jgi:CheY-like chemotaxis protein
MCHSWAFPPETLASPPWLEPMPCSVMVVEDRPEVLQVLVTLLEIDERFTLTGTATNGVQAVAAIAEVCPEAIICDVHVPRMSGLEALPRLRRSCPDAVIVVYTSDPAAAVDARRGGLVNEVVDKSKDPASLLDLVAELCAGAPQGKGD